MVKAGLGPAIVIAKITTMPGKYDTDNASLKALSDAGVADDVVAAVVKADATNKAAVAAEAAKPPRPESPSFTPFSALDKKSKHERLNHPAIISIAGPSGMIRAALIGLFTSRGFVVESDSSNFVSLTYAHTGFAASMLAGMNHSDKVKTELHISISELIGITTVTIDTGLSMENVFGKRSYQSNNKNEKDRIVIENVLMQVKEAAENEK
jgi:hypothetical protein